MEEEFIFKVPVSKVEVTHNVCTLETSNDVNNAVDVGVTCIFEKFKISSKDCTTKRNCNNVNFIYAFISFDFLNVIIKTSCRFHGVTNEGESIKVKVVFANIVFNRCHRNHSVEIISVILRHISN